MTETLSSSGMQHAFAHADDAVSLPTPSPPSLASRPLPPSIITDHHNSFQSPPQSQSTIASLPDLPLDDATHTDLPPTADRELTPPTSSAFSGEEHASTVIKASPDSGKTDSHDFALAVVSGDTQSQRASTGSPTRRGTSREVVSGPKRTASGEIKRSSITSINDLKPEPNGTRRSRTSSILSNGSNGSVMELSQQLRTRLNYAMVKVQNGWQTRSLDEIESIASQSPRSTVSGFQHQHPSNGHTLTSPRSAMTANLHRKWSSSDSSDGGNSGRPHASDLSAGYANSRHSHYHTGQMMARRALAPPADIVPGSRRRPLSNGYAAGPGVNGGHSALHLNVKGGRPKSTQRTPSQNAAMEADAVETLLFMASPNNSGHHPATFSPHESSLRSTQPSQTMSQTSPLRSQFSGSEVLFSPKKVAFVSPQATKANVYDKAAEVDRMLDEFSDDGESSDGLEEAFEVARRRQALAQAAGVGAGR